jgi:hypothetical protein
MQKAQTFNMLLRILMLIDKVGDQILKQQRLVWRFETDRPKVKKVLY